MTDCRNDPTPANNLVAATVPAARHHRWFWTHVDANPALPVYTVRDDRYFKRLVEGFKILSGR